MFAINVTKKKNKAKVLYRIFKDFTRKRSKVKSWKIWKIKKLHNKTEASDTHFFTLNFIRQTYMLIYFNFNLYKTSLNS